MVADAAGSSDRANAVLIDAQDLIVAADFGQIYIMAYTSATPDELGDEDEYDPDSDVVLDEATTSGRFVGVRRWSIRLFTPGQFNPRTPMRVEVWSAEPADDGDGWDHEVDVDLEVPDGLLHIAAPADTTDQAVAARIPAGDYRVRVSGRGFTELGPPAHTATTRIGCACGLGTGGTLRCCASDGRGGTEIPYRRGRRLRPVRHNRTRRPRRAIQPRSARWSSAPARSRWSLSTPPIGYS